ALDRADLTLRFRAQAREPVGGLLAGNGVEVELDALEVVERMLWALVEKLLDPRRAIAVEILAGDVVRVVVGCDAVVRGDEHSARRVDHLGELVIGHVALPLVFAGPAGLGKVGTAAAADRDLADEL